MNTTDFTAMVQYSQQIREAERALARRAFVDDSQVLEPRRTLRERLGIRLVLRRSRAARTAPAPAVPAPRASSSAVRRSAPRHELLTH